MFLQLLQNIEKTVVSRELRKNQIKALEERKKVLIKYLLSIDKGFNWVSFKEAMPNINEGINIEWDFGEKSIKLIGKMVQKNVFIVKIFNEDVIFISGQDGTPLRWKYRSYGA